MFNYFRKEIEWGGRTLVLETGKIARIEMAPPQRMLAALKALGIKLPGE